MEHRERSAYTSHFHRSGDEILEHLLQNLALAGHPPFSERSRHHMLACSPILDSPQGNGLGTPYKELWIHVTSLMKRLSVVLSPMVPVSLNKHGFVSSSVGAKSWNWPFLAQGAKHLKLDKNLVMWVFSIARGSCSFYYHWNAERV